MILLKEKILSTLERWYALFDKLEIVWAIILFGGGFIIIEFYSYSYGNLKLDENQLLYLSSTAAQVLACLFGLTITGYIFFDDKLKRDVETDESLADIVEVLKERYKIHLVILGSLTFISIIFCMFNIIGADSIVNEWLDLWLKISVWISVATIGFIISFVIKIIDPHNIAKASERAKKEIDQDFIENVNKGDLGEFLCEYNKMETAINSFAKKYGSGEFANKKYFREHIGIIDALKLLVLKQVINKDTFNDVNQMRQYRNYIVHSNETEISVSEEACDRIKQLCQLIIEQINNYKMRSVK